MAPAAKKKKVEEEEEQTTPQEAHEAQAYDSSDEGADQRVPSDPEVFRPADVPPEPLTRRDYSVVD